MKLKNKLSGEIKEFSLFDGNELQGGATLESLTKEWEDAPEEPKGYWRITDLGELKSIRLDQHHQNIEKCKQFGNYFETKEEAEKAVEKLKAFKRLKDKGFRFERWLIGGEYGNTITFSDYIEYNDETRADLDLLFGGEE